MDLIDYRQIAEKFTFQEHAERADRYYACVGMNSPQMRKPFADPLESVEISAGIAAILSGLNLFHGARVLDFGAGTCWLGRILAALGCEVTSCDVSEKALELGRRIAYEQGIAMKFARLSGADRLPFEDGAFDRVVVFDAFHHCSDQLAMIREFARILGEDGIAAFHEPGPHHSRTAQSQFEMRTHDVIEGDIEVGDLIAEGEKVGFVDAMLGLFIARPVWCDLSGFNRFLAGDHAGLDAAARQESDNRRVFFMFKGCRTALDSRASTGLQAELSLRGEGVPGGVRIRGTVKNTGPAKWLASGGGVGAVNIGVHLFAAGGTLINNDYARLQLSAVPVRSGDSVRIDGIIPAPEMDHYTMIVDLVAEGVSWFEVRGSEPARFEFA
jgi:SAM-dependent methyltransferase